MRGVRLVPPVLVVLALHVEQGGETADRDGLVETEAKTCVAVAVVEDAFEWFESYGVLRPSGIRDADRARMRATSSC